MPSAHLYFDVSHLPLDYASHIICGDQVGRVGWPVKGSKTMSSKIFGSRFGSVGGC